MLDESAKILNGDNKLARDIALNRNLLNRIYGEQIPGVALRHDVSCQSVIEDSISTGPHKPFEEIRDAMNSQMQEPFYLLVKSLAKNIKELSRDSGYDKQYNEESFAIDGIILDQSGKIDYQNSPHGIASKLDGHGDILQSLFNQGYQITGDDRIGIVLLRLLKERGIVYPFFTSPINQYARDKEDWASMIKLDENINNVQLPMHSYPYKIMDYAPTFVDSPSYIDDFAACVMFAAGCASAYQRYTCSEEELSK